MKASVLVMFEDSIYNYTTSVNPCVSDQEIRHYFVGQKFDLGSFPKEEYWLCINVKITRHADNN